MMWDVGCGRWPTTDADLAAALAASTALLGPTMARKAYLHGTCVSLRFGQMVLGHSRCRGGWTMRLVALAEARVLLQALSQAPSQALSQRWWRCRRRQQ